MDIGYVLFWTVFSVLLGIVYFRFIVLNHLFRTKVIQGFSKASDVLKIQIIRAATWAAAWAAALIPKETNFILEWAIIAIWSLWIGRPYLDMGLNMWPSGGQEYIMAIQNHYVWTLLPKCGVCFFWNGFTNGGAPSFVDTLSGWLHPISIIATFLFGVFNSGKIIVIASFFMAGIGQWWLGKILKLGTISRLWTTLIVVASGSLVGRMEIGSAPLVQSTAACSLVFPAILQLALYGGRKAAIALGIILGLAALSGQGYLQAGLIICLPPTLVVLLMKTDFDGVLRITPNWRYFLFAMILGGLIAAPLLVPLAHYSPNLGKDMDPTFKSAQPLEFTILNLVINDPEFYRTTSLGKEPYGHQNVNYIGWIPVIFAILGLSLAPRKLRKAIFGISVAIIFVYLTSSATILRWISLLHGDFITGIRGPGQIQGLAGPLVLALAGIGAEELIKKEWSPISLPRFTTDQKPSMIKINAKWMIMLLLMASAVYSVSDFAKNWLSVERENKDTNSLIQSLKTPDAQWVQPPYGQYIWLPASIENGLKISELHRPWRITGFALPKTYLEMSSFKEDINSPERFITYGGYVILKRPNSLYASIDSKQSINACKATSIGGFIDVDCDVITSGTLTVTEMALSGWTATRDGQKISLIPKPWLTVDAPAGRHHYAFRYQPWDAPVGIGLSILGWVVAILGLFYFSKRDTNTYDEANTSTR